jgi:CRP-like cAMP-binding protein
MTTDTAKVCLLCYRCYHGQHRGAYVKTNPNNKVISEVLKLGRPYKTSAGQSIFTQGTRAFSLFYLCSGTAVTRISSRSGNEAMIMDVTGGQFFPITALHERGSNYVADGIAQTNCQLVAIQANELRELVLKDVRVSNYFLEISLQRQELVLSQFAGSTLLAATGRIAKWLLDVAHAQSANLSDGIVIPLNISTRAIGLATGGMARETISRQLSWLGHEGIIGRSKNGLTLLDIARLRALADGSLIGKQKMFASRDSSHRQETI